jgi:hypothetical protein
MDRLSEIASELKSIQENSEATYKKSYSYTFNKITYIVESLNDAQRETEDIFLAEAKIKSFKELLKDYGYTDYPHKVPAAVDEIDRMTIQRLYDISEEDIDEFDREFEDD